MDPNFEDLVMRVIEKTHDQKQEKTPDYTQYLRRPQGILMSLARCSKRTIDFSDNNSANTKSLWAVGSVYAMAKSVCEEDNYDKSLEIQSLLHNSGPHMIAQVVHALLAWMVRLSLSKYGNFVAQAAIMNATPALYYEIFGSMIGSFAVLSEDVCGCWVVYALLEKASHAQRQVIKKELSHSKRRRNASSMKIWRLLDCLEAVPSGDK